jgi:hypothetical protein
MVSSVERGARIVLELPDSGMNSAVRYTGASRASCHAWMSWIRFACASRPRGCSLLNPSFSERTISCSASARTSSIVLFATIICST